MAKRQSFEHVHTFIIFFRENKDNAEGAERESPRAAGVDLDYNITNPPRESVGRRIVRQWRNPDSRLSFLPTTDRCQTFASCCIVSVPTYVHVRTADGLLPTADCRRPTAYGRCRCVCAGRPPVLSGAIGGGDVGHRRRGGKEEGRRDDE